jgi:hypothetical protein
VLSQKTSPLKSSLAKAQLGYVGQSVFGQTSPDVAFVCAQQRDARSPFPMNHWVRLCILWDVGNRIVPLNVFVDGVRVYSHCNTSNSEWASIAHVDNLMALTDETRFFLRAPDPGVRLRVSSPSLLPASGLLDLRPVLCAAASRGVFVPDECQRNFSDGRPWHEASHKLLSSTHAAQHHQTQLQRRKAAVEDQSPANGPGSNSRPHAFAL